MSKGSSAHRFASANYQTSSRRKCRTGSKEAKDRYVCTQRVENTIHSTEIIDSTLTDVEGSPLSKLSFFLEVLVSQELPGSVDLLSSLLETLSSLLSISTLPQSDFIYTEQLIMSCMESVATHIEVRSKSLNKLMKCS